MAKAYLEKLSSILQEAATDRFKNVHFECKHFFSGAAVYADGRICMSLTPAGFAIKLPEDLREVLLKEYGAKTLRYFPKGPIKKDYVVLPREMLNNKNDLKRWVKATIEYALTLPKQIKKKLGERTR